MVGQVALRSEETVLTDRDANRLRELVDRSPYRVSHASLLDPLRQELERSRIVPAAAVSRHVVTMRSRVEVKDLATGEVETYTLVYPEEADIDEGKLSVWAPLGVALLGARAGRVIRCRTPGGLRRLKVVKVHYQPEAAGEWKL